MAEFSLIVGKTIASVIADSEQVIFVFTDGMTGKLYHSQDCCESVSLIDGENELQDLVGSPILKAEETSNSDDPAPDQWGDDCQLWTFYRISTLHASANLRWFGSSNGYYSVSVDFDLKEKES